MYADGYDGQIDRMGPENKLAAARRKKLTLSIARTAMARLQSHVDPRRDPRLDKDL